MVNSSWDYVTLCTAIKRNYQHFQEGNAGERKNIGLRAYWSKLHVLEEVKAVWSTDEWSGRLDETVVTEDNCLEILDMMKSIMAPK